MDIFPCMTYNHSLYSVNEHFKEASDKAATLRSGYQSKASHYHRQGVKTALQQGKQVRAKRSHKQNSFQMEQYCYYLKSTSLNILTKKEDISVIFK